VELIFRSPNSIGIKEAGGRRQKGIPINKFRGFDKDARHSSSNKNPCHSRQG
jgi:hypothetical protein